MDSCPVEPIRNYRRQYPDHVIVSYINTSVEVKAESDILCTSRNAVQIVNSIPPDKTILFLPDRNLGSYVQQQTGRKKMKIWQGTCVVHATFPARRLAEARADHPKLWLSRIPSARRRSWRWRTLSAPRRQSSIGVFAQFGSRVHRDDGERSQYSLNKLAPEKSFHFVANENCNCSECPYMRMNTLEKLRDALLYLEPRVELCDGFNAPRARADRADARGQVKRDGHQAPGRFFRATPRQSSDQRYRPL